jgi:hypothetical protein
MAVFLDGLRGIIGFPSETEWMKSISLQDIGARPASFGPTGIFVFRRGNLL